MKEKSNTHASVTDWKYIDCGALKQHVEWWGNNLFYHRVILLTLIVSIYLYDYVEA